jgi:alpha-1,3-rhamnosyl/mannosyltransferase
VPKELARSRFVITVSECSKQRILQEYGLPSSSVLVTPIPPDATVSTPKLTSQQALKRMGIRGPYILFFGTIEPRKNLLNLIDAYESLADTVRANYSLVIAGRIGWNCDAEQTRLKVAQAKSHNVVHVGYVSDTDRSILYQEATMFVTASHYEGFGMPILEAMSYGVPCAISDIPVFHEVAGDAAYYFDEQQPTTIAACLTKLLHSKQARDQLSQQSLARINAMSWEQVARDVLTKIKDTLA